ncbi:hypothetical protein [Pseudomonas sp. F(2018)]|uniref:hypothetical protein n=1 Tax=Pseudomonas sp. F(2018) TaxID=2502240 RepID=UPI0010F8ACF4|nr:hypothetical protein [Pseudomonas sp. F(2018)]
MPAPDTLTPQTPGETATTPAAADPSATTNGQAPQQSTTTTETPPAAPVFKTLHKGGGKHVVVDAAGAVVGDFKGTKAEAEAEALRLAAGGEPLKAAQVEQAPATPAAAAKPDAIDPTTLKQPVLTPDGWLCPAPKQEG